MRLSRVLAGLTYDEYVSTGWYAADDATTMGLISARVQDKARLAVSAVDDEALRLQEMDSIDRLDCNWRHKGMFPFPFTDNELLIRKPFQLRYIAQDLQEVCDEMVRAAERYLQEPANAAAVAMTPYPINKGKGAPFWIPGKSRSGALPLLWLSDHSSSLGEMVERCHDAGARIKPVITLYTRISAAKKMSTRYTADEMGRPVATLDTFKKPKVRKVQGYPFIYNVTMAEVGALALKAARSVPSLGILSSLEDVMARARASSEATMYAEDLSSYDDSVGVEAYLYVVENCLFKLADLCVEAGVLSEARAAKAKDAMVLSASLEIIIPPLAKDHEAELLDRAGAIPSGIRLTSVIGSLINQARIRAVARRANVRILWAEVFSDDTLVAFSSEIDRDRYAAESALVDLHGFEAKAGDDTAFLMRRVPQGYAYLGRMLMSTLQKEHLHEARDVWTAATGIRARRILLRGHPLAQTYDDLLMRADVVGTRLAAAFELARTASPDALVAGILAMRKATGDTAAHTLDTAIGFAEDELGHEILTAEDVVGTPFEAFAPLITSTAPTLPALRDATTAHYGASESGWQAVKRDLTPWTE